MDCIKNTERPRDRFNCENGACNRPREHYCHGHKKVLCDDCYTSFHSDCICEEIKRKERVKNHLNVVKREILFACKESKQIDAVGHFPDIDSELSQFETKIKEIEVKLKNAVNKDQFCEYGLLIKEVIELKRTFRRSNSFFNLMDFGFSKACTKEYGKHTMQACLKNICSSKFIRIHYHYHSFLRDNIDRQSCYNAEDSEAEENTSSYRYISVHRRNYIDRIGTELKEQVHKENKEKIDALEAKINEQDQTIKNLNEENCKLTEEEEKVKEVRKEDSEKIKYENDELFNLIYERNMGSKPSDLSNSAFDFELTTAKSKAFFDDLATSQIRIPMIKRIHIKYPADSNPNINYFLSSCIPENLKCLAINFNSTNATALKMSYYLSSMTTAMKNVTKEVLIRCFDLSVSELEEVIKAGYNSERVVLCYCNLKCSSDMDFTTSNTYKTTIVKININLFIWIYYLIF